MLVLLGLCGNLAIPFISYRTTLRCPHITMLAALDFTATLLGPGVMLVIIVVGPVWLEHNKFLCHGLSFLSSWLLITSFLVLFSFAVFCQKVQHNDLRSEKRRGLAREFAFLTVSFFTGMLLGIVPLLGWSTYSALFSVHSCTAPHHIVTHSNYSVCCLAFSLVVILISTFLAIKALKKRQFYPMQLFWERHMLETKINDPEMTTAGSSEQSSAGQSGFFCSRDSSLNSRRSRSVLTSAFSSPMVTRRASQKSVLLEGTLNALIGIYIARQNERKNVQHMESGNGQSSEPEAPRPMLPNVTVSSSPPHGIPLNPFVISSRLPYTYQKKKNVFKAPRFLPQLQAPQQRRSLSRLLSLRCCVTLLCWLPLYVTVVLQLFSVHYPQELNVFIQWLIFMQSSISPMLPLCDGSYRQVWQRIAFSCFKACAKPSGIHADISKSRIEESQQVRLKEVISLDASRL